MNQLHEDGFTLLIAAIVRQAVEDARDGYTHRDRPDARAFLIAAGLCSASGDLDKRFSTSPMTRTGRPSHRKAAA